MKANLHGGSIIRKLLPVITFVLLIYYLILLRAMCNDVFPLYSPNTFDTDENTTRSVVAWVFYLPLAAIISVRLNKHERISYLAYGFLFILNGAAFFAIFPYKNTMSNESFAASTVFLYIMAIICAVPNLHVKLRNGKVLLIFDDISLVKQGFVEEHQEKKSSSKLMTLVLFVSVGAIAIFSLLFADFRIFISFSDVYSARFQFLETQLPAVINYGIRFLSGAMLPYLFVYYLQRKNKVLSLVALFGGLLSYGIDGLKTTLLIYIIAFVFHLTFNRRGSVYKNFNRLIPFFLTVLCLGIQLVYFLFVKYDIRFFSAEIYRALVIPASIADNYIAYIQPREALLLRQSVLRAFFESPYDRPLYYLVSSQMNNGRQAIANTGLVGDAYANFKWLGIMIYPFLYQQIFAWWERFARGAAKEVVVMVAFIMVWNAINISYFTWLISGGVIMFFVMHFINKVKSQ